MAVANGKADVATFNSSSMKRLTGTHPDVAEKLRVVWTSPVIPDNPMVWRKALPEVKYANLYGPTAPKGLTPLPNARSFRKLTGKGSGPRTTASLSRSEKSSATVR